MHTVNPLAEFGILFHNSCEMFDVDGKMSGAAVQALYSIYILYVELNHLRGTFWRKSAESGGVQCPPHCYCSH